MRRLRYVLRPCQCRCMLASVIAMKGAAVDAIECIERATAFASDKVKAVTAADLSKPTPCSDSICGHC